MSHKYASHSSDNIKRQLNGIYHQVILNFAEVNEAEEQGGYEEELSEEIYKKISGEGGLSEEGVDYYQNDPINYHPMIHEYDQNYYRKGGRGI